MKWNGSVAMALFGICAGVVFGQEPPPQDQPQQDPPSRVARLNYISGRVSIEPEGANDWSPAVVNRPFTTGDYLWTDSRSRAEFHLDNAVLRLGDRTSFGFLNLDDRVAQVKLSEGELRVRVRQLDSGETFEIDTPNAAILVLQPGEYRFHVGQDNRSSAVAVLRGEAEVSGGGQVFRVREGASASLSGTDALAYEMGPAPRPDDFDRWCQERDAREARAESARYLPPDVIGYEDLDGHGVWRELPGYGPVWYPSVGPGWAPYRMGHWAYIRPWGWTWVDEAPWGFAPFHYGRWVHSGGWCWVPGPIVVAGGPGRGMMVARVRPVYSPALVAFIGGNNWGVSISAGGGPAVGWAPLGPGEVYRPAYRVSPHYFNRVNVSNTVVQNNVNITNVYNTTYVNNTNVNNRVVNQRFVNASAPNAVTAMSQNEFASGRSASQAGRSLQGAELARMQNAQVMTAPQVRPTRQAPTDGGARAARPSERAMNTQVVTRTAPPAAAGRPAPQADGAQQQRGWRRFGDTQKAAPAPQADRPARMNRPADQVRQPAVERPARVNRPTDQVQQPAVDRPERVNRPADQVRQPAVERPQPRPQADRPAPQRREQPAVAPSEDRRARPERRAPEKAKEERKEERKVERKTGKERPQQQ